MAHTSPEWLPDFSRRTLLRCALRWISVFPGCVRNAAAAAAPTRKAEFHTVLERFRRTTAYQRHYRVHATVLMLGVPVLSRRDVGGGYASVETGFAGGVQAVGLQFAVGA